jgi:hypothetical protein
VATDPLLLCEGEHDEKLLANLMGVRNLPAFQIQQPGGEENYGVSGFQLRLRGLKAAPGIQDRKAIIIVADNDDAPSQAFKLVRKQVKKAGGYGVPNAPRQLARSKSFPPVSVLMVPWDSDRGCVETLCYTSAAARRPELAKCVEEYIDCVGATQWPIAQLSKLRLRCLLSAACKKDPNTGLPRAWTAEKGRPSDLIPLDHECFNQIADYLRTFT